MDKETGSVFASFLLITGIFTGVNYIVTDSQEVSFMGWAILAIGAAIGIWWWLTRQDKMQQEAAEAERSMREAEAKAAELNAAAQASLQTPTPADDVIQQVGEAGIEDNEAVEETTDDATETVETAQETTEAATKAVEAATDDTTKAVEAITETSGAEETSQETEIQPEDAVPAAVDGDPDDLTKIEGIGPYYQRILVESGVTSFEALAALNEDDIAELIKKAGGRRSNTISTWAEQAALAAKGDWEGLAQLQDELDGGRRS